MGGTDEERRAGAEGSEEKAVSVYFLSVFTSSLRYLPSFDELHSSPKSFSLTNGSSKSFAMDFRTATRFLRCDFCYADFCSRVFR